MQPLLIILLLLSVLTNVLLILLLLRSGQQNTAEDQTDEIARIVRDEVEAETEVLADQLRVMQGEVTRTTSASARDMGTLLAESQRQSQEAATARLDAIDRAGAARQRAANDALLAQLQVLETRLKNLEDTNANRLDGVRATLLQGMANIRADNNKKLDEIRGMAGSISSPNVAVTLPLPGSIRARAASLSEKTSSSAPRFVRTSGILARYCTPSR